MVCVIAKTETKPAWDSFLKNPHFVPKQNAVVELKKLMPVKNKVNVEHLVTVYGTGLTATQKAGMIGEINKESLTVVGWGKTQVKQKMMFAMTRVGLKVDGRHAKKFCDIKKSLRDDSSDENVAKIYEILYGDYEGVENKGWSSVLQEKYMLEQNLEYPVDAKNMRDKGGIEKCITKAKGDMVEKVWGKGGTRLVLSLKGERNLPPEFVAERKKQKAMVDKREAKANRRNIGEFFLKKKVRLKFA